MEYIISQNGIKPGFVVSRPISRLRHIFVLPSTRQDVRRMRLAVPALAYMDGFGYVFDHPRMFESVQSARKYIEANVDKCPELSSWQIMQYDIASQRII